MRGRNKHKQISYKKVSLVNSGRHCKSSLRLHGGTFNGGAISGKFNNSSRVRETEEREKAVPEREEGKRRRRKLLIARQIFPRVYYVCLGVALLHVITP